jgi:DnaJ-class molecular chaperone
MMGWWGTPKKTKDFDEALRKIFEDEDENPDPSDTLKMFMEFVECPDCKGTGEVLLLFTVKKCSRCIGHGKLLKD